MSDTVPTAAIEAHVLEAAAKRAEAYHLVSLNEMREQFVLRVTATRHGPFWNRRFYSMEDATRAWALDHSSIGYHFAAEVFQAPRGAHWHADRLDRARELVKLATTSGLSAIRIPEFDARFLRDHLNEVTDVEG